MRTVAFAAFLVGFMLAIFSDLAFGENGPEKNLRVGVYDNRAVAIAFAGSKFNPVAEKMKEYRKAKAEGDSAKVKELEAWGPRQQRKLHRQGFGRMPVDDILAYVKERLPEVAQKAGVAAIVWQCDFAGPGVEVVDITKEMVLLFEPSEKTLKMAEEIQKMPPIDLDTIEQSHRD